MILTHTFSWYHGAACLVFLVLYLLYIRRMVRIGKAIRSPFRAIFVKIALRTAYFALCLIALLGPSLEGGKRETKLAGKDIMFCIDLSKSMNAVDIQPSRIEKLKYEIKKVIDAFSSDRLGIIIFSSEAYMQCPLTYDKNALYLFIETMNSNLVPGGGTDFASPLRMAISKLNDANKKKTSGKTRTQIIILVSDGEDFGDSTSDIMEQIEEEGVKLFTLGIGTEAGGRIPEGNSYKIDKDGNEVVSKLDSKTLQALASKADGKYFEINASRNDINRIISSIGGIEGEVREAKILNVSDNIYFYFLFPAFLLFIIDIFVNIKTLKV